MLSGSHRRFDTSRVRVSVRVEVRGVVSEGTTPSDLEMCRGVSNSEMVGKARSPLMHYRGYLCARAWRVGGGNVAI